MSDFEERIRNLEARVESIESHLEAAPGPQLNDELEGLIRRVDPQTQKEMFLVCAYTFEQRHDSPFTTADIRSIWEEARFPSASNLSDVSNRVENDGFLNVVGEENHVEQLQLTRDGLNRIRTDLHED